MAAVYLDHNATTVPAPEVAEAVSLVMAGVPGNPSTLYGSGRASRSLLDAARAKVARFIGASDPCELVFTSGGTEANNTVLAGICRLRAKRGGHLIVPMAEHKSILRAAAAMEAQGYGVTYLPVDRLGRVDPEEVKKAITPETILVSVMFANNEVGTINPVREIASVCREAGVPLHTDAVQACGKIPVDVKELGVDFLTLSAHKFHGPRGIGALWIRRGAALLPILHGGTQEGGLRPGTENVAGAHGMAVAADLAARRLEGEPSRLRSLRKRLVEGICEVAPAARFHGDPERGLPNTVSVSFPGWDAEKLVLALDAEGIELGTGSACTTGQTTPSHVLLAMGVPPKEARSAVRFSLGLDNSEEDIAAALAALTKVCSRGG